MEPRWHRATFPSRRHERVHDLLARLVSEGTAHFFADACDIARRQPPYRTTSHITAHLLREVEGALLSVLHSLPEVQQRLPPPTGDSKDKHLAKIDAILQVLELQENDVAFAWRTFAKGDAWVRRAHRDDLRFPREVDEAFASRFEEFVDVLAVVLDAAEANYAALIRALGGACAKPTPSAADVDFVATHLAPGVAAVAHIFAGLSAAWLVPLRQKGVFKAPPEVVFHEGGSYSFPSWPQASHLERIALESPEEVTKTIETVPVVDNETIHWAFLRIAVRLPAPQAKRIATRETPWLASESWRDGPIPNAVSALARHLIDEGELDGALNLLRPALALQRDVADGRSNDERRTRMSEWDFEAMVRNTVGALADRDASRTKEFLFTCLNEDKSEDASWWREAVEDHSQNRFSEPRDQLFVELRTLFEREIELRGEEALRSAVIELEARRSGIYARLALHLLRRFGALARDLIVERATDQSILDSVEMFHEVASMIADQFPLLDTDEQQQVLRALRENSSLDHVRERYGGTIERDELSHYVRLERRRWFSILGPHRPEDVAMEYETLCEGIGEPEHPTFASWMGSVRKGPNPPMSMPELMALPDDVLLRYLAEWTVTVRPPPS